MAQLIYIYYILLTLFLVRHTERSEPMLKADLRTIPLAECNRTILEYNKDRNLPILKHGVSKSQFCAYDPHDMGHRCQILGGGALQTFPSNAILPNIIGIASFEFSSLGFGGGCSSRQPGIFTRVANYVPWIESNVWPFHRSKYDLIPILILSVLSPSIDVVVQ